VFNWERRESPVEFTLQVGTQAQSVEVTIAADTLLATSSSSIGEVLSQQRVQDLPMVSNNVLDLYRLMPEFESTRTR